MQKLYVVTRADLKPGAIVAQSCHAVSAFARVFPDAHADWLDRGQNIVVLACRDEAALGALLDSFGDEILRECVTFQEPDLGHALTAFAVSDRAAKALSSLPLALREPRCPDCKEAPLVPICARCAA